MRMIMGLGSLDWIGRREKTSGSIVMLLLER